MEYKLLNVTSNVWKLLFGSSLHMYTLETKCCTDNNFASFHGFTLVNYDLILNSFNFPSLIVK